MSAETSTRADASAHDFSGSTLRGVLLVVAAVSLFAVTDAAGKLLSETQSLSQIVWGRYLFSVPVILLLTPRHVWPVLFSVRNPAVQAGRALLPMMASFFVVGGLAYLPLAEVTALTFASPLLVVALAGAVLKERSTVHDWIGVVLGFIGILVIVRPGSAAFSWAALLPLGCAACFAIFQLLTRLVGRSDDPASTLAWTIAVGLAITSVLAAFDWKAVDPGTWLLLLVSGLSFGAAQFMLIAAFRLAPAALLTPFTYTQIVLAVILGLVLFGSVPDAVVALGTAIVIGAGLYVLWRRTPPR